MAIFPRHNHDFDTSQQNDMSTNMPISELEKWAVLNEVSFNGVTCAQAGEDRGSGLIATRDLKGGEEAPLLVVPRDLVLSLETVRVAAKSDKDLRALLDALGEFVQTPRGAILTFLLYLRTVAVARENNYPLGSLTPFNQYISFLPNELLPTFWTSDEVELLRGTSIHAALSAKQKSLAREFSHLCDATQDVRWCQDIWWDSESEKYNLCLDDWKTVDAMYRSRALEFPGIGDSMVPCIDMANHAAGAATIALYESDGAGNAVLLLRDSVNVKKGEEITITYGDNKGACEMLFSYGFIDDGMTSANELFLPLQMPGDDPLAGPKDHVSTTAPGVKFYKDEEGKLKWHSEYIYLMTVNQEDGLNFAWAQLTTGERELQMLWHDAPVASTAQLSSLLQQDKNYDLFRLRAVAILLERVEGQLEVMVNADVDAARGEGTDIRERCYKLAAQLRHLEGDFLMDALAVLNREKDELLEGSQAVKAYLEAQATGGDNEETVEAGEEGKRDDAEEAEDFT